MDHIAVLFAQSPPFVDALTPTGVCLGGRQRGRRRAEHGDKCDRLSCQDDFLDDGEDGLSGSKESKGVFAGFVRQMSGTQASLG